MVQPERLGVALKGFSVKAPPEERGEYLLVLRGLDPEGVPVVSFTSATTLEECFRSAVARMRNGQMRWREDEYGR